MPTLPDLPYKDNGRKISMTKFTGIKRNGGDGALYDGLNMSADDAPYISTRMGFARVGLTKDGADYTPDFSVKATVMLADGSGIVYVGESKAATHDLATGTVTETSFGKTVTVNPYSVVSFVRERTVEIPAGVDYNGDAITVKQYEYTFYITLVMSAKLAIIKKVRKTVYNDDTPDLTETDSYTTVMGEAVKRTSEDYIVDQYTLSTWFGKTGATHTMPTPAESPKPKVNETNPPIFINPSEQSVISSKDDDINALVRPGLYYSVHRQLGNVGDVDYVNETHTGLASEIFSNDKITLNYGDFDEPDKPLYGALFFDDDAEKPAGFKGNVKTLHYTPPVGYYAPRSGVYTVSWGDAPDNIRGAFFAGNRLWVYDEYSIYASHLGKYELFSTADGTEDGGWSVTLPGRTRITGGIEYAGRPVFFTESTIITVYGGYPSAFSLRIVDGQGVEHGSEASLKQVGYALYYLSKNGVMRYAGNTPTCISDELTQVQLNNGRAETDGRYYILYAETLKQRAGEPAGMLCVWDTFQKLWHTWQYIGTSGKNSHIRNENRVDLITDPTFCFVRYEPDEIAHIVMTVGGTNTFKVCAIPTFERQALIYGAVTRADYFGYNDSVFWGFRLGRFYMSTPNMKRLKAIHLRARLISQPRVEGARLDVKLCYDDADAHLNGRYIEDDEGFETVYTVTEPQNDAVDGEIYAERNIYIPLIPRRCESFKVEISGTERWQISDLSFEYDVVNKT